VHWFNPFLWRRPGGWYWLAYGAAVGFFILSIAQFYMAGKGFTSFILFGGKPEMRRIKELKAASYYVEEDSYGYDAQYYVQIAVKPLLMSRDLQASMDNLPYRARRILFCWTAYVLGLGQPRLILQAYALQNVLCWLLLEAAASLVPSDEPGQPRALGGDDVRVGSDDERALGADGRSQSAADRLGRGAGRAGLPLEIGVRARHCRTRPGNKSAGRLDPRPGARLGLA
jgi:hypothetical protein